jgi:hypothetical protein
MKRRALRVSLRPSREYRTTHANARADLHGLHMKINISFTEFSAPVSAASARIKRFFGYATLRPGRATDACPAPGSRVRTRPPGAHRVLEKPPDKDDVVIGIIEKHQIPGA